MESEVPGTVAVEELLAVLVTYLTLFAELAGALVIGVAVVRALLQFVPHIFRRQPADETYSEEICLQLGKSLALGLEFALGADILKTAVAPTIEDISAAGGDRRVTNVITFLSASCVRSKNAGHVRTTRLHRSMLQAHQSTHRPRSDDRW